MEWYYVDNGRQAGPVSEADLDRLLQEGRITNDTLVWREGMANWERHSSARMAVAAGSSGIPVSEPAQQTPAGEYAYPTDDAAFCSECGRRFSANDMVRFGNSYVCPSCKINYVQRVKEGVPVSSGFVLASIWHRLLGRIIDGLITILPLAILIGIFVAVSGSGSGDQSSFQWAFALVQYPVLILVVAYETYFVGKTGQTPGKKLANVRVVREDGSSLDYQAALARSAVRQVIPAIPIIGAIATLVIFVVDIMAIFDQEHRTLPDRVCKTRVITA